MSKTEKSRTKIVVVDDHPIVRQGLTELVNREVDLEICGQCADAIQAMQTIKQLQPDMAIVDISLKGTNGVELIKNIKLRYPHMSILALSMHDESVYAERVLRAGADGYIMKAEATENVITAIRRIIGGQIYLSDRMGPKLLRKLVGLAPGASVSPVDCLSDRELEVFRLIGQGYPTRQIAAKLCLSTKTIDTHRAHIREKLNIAGGAELLQYAIKWLSSQDKPAAPNSD